MLNKSILISIVLGETPKVTVEMHGSTEPKTQNDGFPRYFIGSQSVHGMRWWGGWDPESDRLPRVFFVHDEPRVWVRHLAVATSVLDECLSKSGGWRIYVQQDATRCMDPIGLGGPREGRSPETTAPEATTPQTTTPEAPQVPSPNTKIPLPRWRIGFTGETGRNYWVAFEEHGQYVRTQNFEEGKVFGSFEDAVGCYQRITRLGHPNELPPAYAWRWHRTDTEGIHVEHFEEKGSL